LKTVPDNGALCGPSRGIGHTESDFNRPPVCS
jgi:hypothetical protein